MKRLFSLLALLVLFIVQTDGQYFGGYASYGYGCNTYGGYSPYGVHNPYDSWFSGLREATAKGWGWLTSAFGKK
uniref:Secreted protein n=1 Tax=Angiostrongylus cantonensis TaxID=6313 RepID=A0A0K0CZ60_ANGCA